MSVEIPAICNARRSRILAALILISIAQSAAAIATVMLVRYGFDALVGQERQAWQELIIYLGSGLLICALFGAWLKIRERIEAERIGQDYVHKLRMTLYKRLSVLSSRALQRRGRGGILLRFLGDLTALRQWVSLGIARLTVAGLTTVCTLIALAFMDWMLASVVAAILFIGALASLAMGKRLNKTVREVRQRRTYLANNVNEKVTSMAVVQVFGQHLREMRRVDRQSLRLMESMLDRAQKIGILRAIADGSGRIASSGILLLGIYKVAAGHTTAGTVVAAMTIVGFLAPALQNLGRVHEYWHGSRISKEKIQSFLDIPCLVEEAPNPVKLPKGPGRIVFEQVTVENALTDFNAVFEPRLVYAIIGPNGAGKSTILSLIARLFDPDSGTIRIDGVDISTARLSSLRKAVGIVSLDLPLLRGTVDKNLRYRWRNAPEKEIDRVTSLCRIDEMLKDLPEKRKTRVQDGGQNLSFGQRQRIALARAILRKPKILLLDEANANLDADSVEIFDEIVSNYSGTVIMVTHRQDRLAAADKVFYLNKSRLVEEEVLLKQVGRPCLVS